MIAHLELAANSLQLDLVRNGQSDRTSNRFGWRWSFYAKLDACSGSAGKGERHQPLTKSLKVYIFGNTQRIFEFNSQVAHRAVNLCMS